MYTGCYEEFNELLNKIQYNKEQIRLVLLGDLVDRGPDAPAVVAKARELQLESVKGNHEDRVVRWLKHEHARKTSGIKNPMKYVSDYDAIEANKLTSDDINYLKTLPLKLYLDNNFYAIHAGVEPGVDFDKQIPAQLMRVRYVNEKGRGVSLNSDKSQPEGTVYWDQAYKGDKNIVYGHCVHDLVNPRQVLTESNAYCVGIDTGCVFGGHLTGMFLHFVNGEFRPEFVQVKAKQAYAKG